MFMSIVYLVLFVMGVAAIVTVIVDLYGNYRIKADLEDPKLKKLWDVVNEDLKNGMNWKSGPSLTRWSGFYGVSFTNENIPGMTVHAFDIGGGFFKKPSITLGGCSLSEFASNSYMESIAYKILNSWWMVEKDRQDQLGEETKENNKKTFSAFISKYNNKEDE